jgi:hypothetical protein
MASSAELYLLPRDKFEEYCTMSRLVTLTDAPEKMTMGHIILKGRKEIDEFIKRQKLYNAAGKFLKKHSEQPYEYRWSGYVFSDLLMFLRSKRINLMKNTLVDTRSGNQWYVVDSQMKERYLDKLDHRNFREEDLKHYHQLHERKVLTQVSKLLGNRTGRSVLVEGDDFPKAGKQMLDGIKVIRKYLNRMSDDSILLITTTF